MTKYNQWDDESLYQDYEEAFQLGGNNRQRRRKERYPKPAAPEIAQLTDDTNVGMGFKMTYNPGKEDKHEATWLTESLQNFFYQDYITDVVAQVKGGKEASVYRCIPHAALQDVTWVAAKVYRPRMFRHLRNDKMYREGRNTLGIDGKALNDKDWRARKAMNSGSDFGQSLAHTSWLMYEFNTLRTLYKAGASVPQPIAASENALLMQYIGNEQMPAPILNEVDLSPDEARTLFEDTLRNINIMLQHGFIHGDLSAFNILYWQGAIVLIDFPQVVQIDSNPHARNILTRDVTRICEYFERQGVNSDPQAIANELWYAYGMPDADPEEVMDNILAGIEAQEYLADDD